MVLVDVAPLITREKMAENLGLNAQVWVQDKECIEMNHLSFFEKYNILVSCMSLTLLLVKIES